MALPDWMQRLWRGEVPLWKAFWLYSVLGATVVNIVAIMGPVLMAAAVEKLGYPGEPADAIFGLTIVVLGPIALSYMLLAGVGTIRSGLRRGGFLGILAVIAVVLGFIRPVITLVMLIVMGIGFVGARVASILA